MSDKQERLNRLDKREQTEKTEEKRSLRILSQVIALILCLLVSFSVWLVVHYRQDKNQPASTDGEASAAYPIVTADL